MGRQAGKTRAPTIRVETPARIHFGLLSLRADAPRRFGGVGLMVGAPGFALGVEPLPGAADCVFSGPAADRAEEFASRFRRSLTPEQARRLPAFRLSVARDVPQHAGLGAGTQLGMAVSAALSRLAGLPPQSPAELAGRVGRGLRSAVGLHGFAVGGLLTEGGKRRPQDVSPLISRLDFPPDWPVVLTIPPGLTGLSGRDEVAAFRDLPDFPEPAGDRLCALVLLGLLPSAADGDLPAFSEALFELQQKVGEHFRPAQGGIYAHPLLEEIVAFLRAAGVAGVGQSSWGPTLYAVCGDDDHARHTAGLLVRRFGPACGEPLITRAANTGARITAAE